MYHRQNPSDSISSIFMCICCRDNVLSELLPSGDRGGHIQTQTDGRDLRRLDGFKYHEIHSKLLKHRFRNSKVNKGDAQAQNGVAGFLPRWTDFCLGLILRAVVCVPALTRSDSMVK
jgi:hypothetical protein